MLLARLVDRFWRWENARRDPAHLLQCSECDGAFRRADGHRTNEGTLTCSPRCVVAYERGRAW